MCRSLANCRVNERTLCGNVPDIQPLFAASGLELVHFPSFGHSAPHQVSQEAGEDEENDQRQFDTIENLFGRPIGSLHFQ